VHPFFLPVTYELQVRTMQPEKRSVLAAVTAGQNVTFPGQAPTAPSTWSDVKRSVGPIQRAIKWVAVGYFKLIELALRVWWFMFKLKMLVVAGAFAFWGLKALQGA
jgi:hypothetical protein